MIAPNIFRTRNDWNVVALNSIKYRGMTFEGHVAGFIKDIFNINPLLSNEYRGRKLCEARQVFMTLVSKHSTMTLSAVGRLVGKDHATVLHAIKTIENLCETDPKFDYKYNQVKEKVIKLKK